MALKKPNKLDVGRLDERVTLLSYTASIGAAGGEELTWSTLAIVWAAVFYKSTSEKIEGDKETALNTIEIIMRYRTDVTEKSRISFKSVEYDITGIQEVNRRTYMRLICTRKDGQ